jgi:histidyl-tRNA synthetase
MASEEFQPIQGMSDLAPPEIGLWQRLEAAARRLFVLYGFEEVRTPVIEKESLFIRSLGDSTDVVQKEMYAFEDRGGRRLAVRPEGTASVIRYVASRGQEAQDARLFYWGPMFRAERPQAGRRRQFHQVGAEAIGGANAAADAEMIALQIHLLSAWGLKQHVLHINTRGLPADRKAVQEGLARALQPHEAQLCDDCRKRLQVNLLRVLDCKNETCGAIVAGLPPVSSFMSAEARAYLDEVLRLLKALEIDARVNPRLVRGLDYYVHTVWEITHPGLGAQDALAGGGRYALELGSRTVEGVGFAMGVERVITACRADAVADPESPAPLAWIISLGDRAFEDNLRLVQSLRMRGVACGLDLGRRSIKAQMKMADRSKARFVVLRGDTEMEKGTFMFKEMASGAQTEIAMPELLERLSSTPRLE